MNKSVTNESDQTIDQTEDYEVVTLSNFEQMKLSEPILRGIYSYGYEFPSQIQSKAIVPITLGRDVIAQAQSGTGKTATFVIGMLQRITEENELQAIILAPTRELVDQIELVVKCISSYMSITCITCKGGTPVNENIKALKNGVQVICGTTGRVLDLMKRNEIKVHHLKLLVIDEADEMLSIGFKDQMYEIFDMIPLESQLCFFSATMNQNTIRMANHIMKTPVHIRVLQEEITLEGIRQFYVNVENEQWKLDTLCDLYENITITQAIIYCNTKKTVDWLTKELTNRDFSVSAFHSELSQVERDQLMKQFRTGQTRVLLSTDILCRGIDVQQVSIIFNYDIPIKKESYIHRIGRTGRFGRKGIAINFITEDTKHVLRHIQHFYNTDIEELSYEFFTNP